jgi:hypothetical protein
LLFFKPKKIGIVLSRDIELSVRAFLEDDFLFEVLLDDFGAPLAEDLDWIQVFDLVLFDQLEFLLIYRPSRHFFILVALVSHFCEVFELLVPRRPHAFQLGFLCIELVCPER